MVTQNIHATLRFFANMFFLLGTMMCVLVVALFAKILCDPDSEREVLSSADLTN